MELPRQYRTLFSVDSDPVPTATRGLRVGDTGEAFRTDLLAALGLIQSYAEGRESHLGVAEKPTAAVRSSDCRSYRTKLVPIPCDSEARACKSCYRSIRSIGKSHRLRLAGRPKSMTYEGMHAWLASTDIRPGGRSWLVPTAIAAGIVLMTPLLLLQCKDTGGLVLEKDRNTLYLVDISDSMNGDWGAFGITYIDAARLMLRQNVLAMPADNTTNIIAFNEEVRALCPGIGKLNDADKRTLVGDIDQLNAERFAHTNLELALEEAFRQLNKLRDGTEVTVEIYTDGWPTVGELDLDKLRDLVRRHNHNLGAKIHTFGFGDAFTKRAQEAAKSNDKVLEAQLNAYVDFLNKLANENRGRFHDLSDPREIGIDTSLLGRAKRLLDGLQLPWNVPGTTSGMGSGTTPGAGLGTGQETAPGTDSEPLLRNRLQFSWDGLW